MSGSFSAYDRPFNLLPSSSVSRSSVMVLSTTPAAGSASASVPALGSRLRSSCDRCHAQKLRCVKRKDTSACQRCLNLDTLCHFSPRASRIYAKNRQREADFGGNARRALAAAPSVSFDLASSTGASSSIWPLNTSDIIDTSDAQGLYLDLCSPIQGGPSGMNALMWPGIYSQPHDINLLDINNPTNFDPTSFADIGANPLSSADASHCDRGLMIHGRHGSSESQSASLVQRLANLSVKIYSCTAAFLDKGQENVNSTDSSRQSASEPPKSIYLDFDQLFSLTTDFINVLKSISVLEKDVASSSYSDNILEHTMSQSLSSSLVPCGEQMAEAALPSTRSQVDEATMLLIASCNSQLVDAYVSIFDKAETCIEHARVPVRASSWVVLLPKLQVGPVALSKVQVSDKSPVSSKSQSFMYIVLVVTLASQLWEQVVDVLRAGTAGLDGSSSSELTAILDIIMGKMNSLMKKINTIKDLVGRRSGDEPL